MIMVLMVAGTSDDDAATAAVVRLVSWSPPPLAMLQRKFNPQAAAPVSGHVQLLLEGLLAHGTHVRGTEIRVDDVVARVVALHHRVVARAPACVRACVQQKRARAHHFT